MKREETDFTLENKLEIFKTGVKPMWEDEKNKMGGKFSCVFPSLPLENARNLFFVLLVNVTRGVFASPSNIVKTFLFSPKKRRIFSSSLFFPKKKLGIGCVRREWGVSLTLWNKDATHLKQIYKIKKKLKAIFILSKVKYQPHSDNLLKPNVYGPTPSPSQSPASPSRKKPSVKGKYGKLEGNRAFGKKGLERGKSKSVEEKVGGVNILPRNAKVNPQFKNVERTSKSIDVQSVPVNNNNNNKNNEENVNENTNESESNYSNDNSESEESREERKIKFSTPYKEKKHRRERSEGGTSFSNQAPFLTTTVIIGESIPDNESSNKKFSKSKRRPADEGKSFFVENSVAQETNPNQPSTQHTSDDLHASETLQQQNNQQTEMTSPPLGNPSNNSTTNNNKEQQKLLQPNSSLNSYSILFLFVCLLVLLFSILLN